jgi:hypothetical protein
LHGTVHSLCHVVLRRGFGFRVLLMKLMLLQ